MIDVLVRGWVCGQIEELRIELTALRHLVRLKNKELRTIRRLSETILSQRSEVRCGSPSGVTPLSTGLCTPPLVRALPCVCVCARAMSCTFCCARCCVLALALCYPAVRCCAVFVSGLRAPPPHV